MGSFVVRLHMIVAVALTLAQLCVAERSHLRGIFGRENGDPCEPTFYSRSPQGYVRNKMGNSNVLSRKANAKEVSCDTQGTKKQNKGGPEFCHHETHDYEQPVYECAEKGPDRWACRADKDGLRFYWVSSPTCKRAYTYPTSCNKKKVYHFKYNKTFIGSTVPVSETTLLITTATYGKTPSTGWFLFNLKENTFTDMAPLVLGGKIPGSINMVRGKEGNLFVVAFFQDEACIFVGDIPQNFPKFTKISCVKLHKNKQFDKKGLALTYSNLLSNNLTSAVVYFTKFSLGGNDGELIRYQFSLQDFVPKKRGNLTVPRGKYIFETGVLTKETPRSKHLPAGNFKSINGISIDYISGFVCKKGKVIIYVNTGNLISKEAIPNFYAVKGNTNRAMECLFGCPFIPRLGRPGCDGKRHRNELYKIIKSC